MPKKKRPEKVIIHGIYQCESCKKAREGNRGNLVYMDPPYHGTKNLYGTKAWTEVDFVRMRNHFHELCCLGFSVILSMSDTPFIRELFKGYNIREVPFVYHANRRKKVTELIITNFNDEQLKKVIRGKKAGMIKIK